MTPDEVAREFCEWHDNLDEAFWDDAADAGSILDTMELAFKGGKGSNNPTERNQMRTVLRDFGREKIEITDAEAEWEETKQLHREQIPGIYLDHLSERYGIANQVRECVLRSISRQSFKLEEGQSWAQM